MAGVTPNVSRDSFDFSKAYEKLSLQQGVPIMDSDWNEALDNIWIRGVHMLNHLFIGNCRFPIVEPDGTETSGSGFRVEESTTDNTNNFTISAGYACCYGVVVGSTQTMPPADIEYEDQEMFSGTISVVSGSDIVDDDKAFSADHDLVGCRVKMTSGAASGAIRPISARVSGTRITISSVVGVSSGDTYVIIPPELTTPPLSNRDDDVYLQVYFEDMNEDEDSAINHPGTGIESVHKTKIRSVVRVAEDSSYSNSTATGALASYAVRTMKIATLRRLVSDTRIQTSMIDEEDNLKRGLGVLDAEDIPFGLSNFTGLGYDIGTGGANVQDAVDGVITSLSDDSDPALGAGLIGIGDVSGAPNSLSAGTLYDAMGELLEHVNHRLNQIHPTSSISEPLLIWRSHNKTADSHVDSDTTSVYLLNTPTGLGGDCIAFCHGCYLDGALAYPANDSPVTASIFMWGANGSKHTSKELPLASWSWDTDADWDAIEEYARPLTILSGRSIGLSGQKGSVTLGLNSITDGADHDGEAYISGYMPTPVVNPLKFFTAYDPDYCGPHIYYTSEGLWITSNAHWSSITNEWYPNDDTEDANAVLIATYGVIFYHKSSSTPGYSSGWPLDTWDAAQRIGQVVGAEAASAGTNYIYGGITSTGNIYERSYYSLFFSFRFSSITDTISLMGMEQANNFKTRWSTPPASYSMIESSSNLKDTCTVSEVGNWGFEIDMNVVNVTANVYNAAYVRGEVEFYN